MATININILKRTLFAKGIYLILDNNFDDNIEIVNTYLSDNGESPIAIINVFTKDGNDFSLGDFDLLPDGETIYFKANGVIGKDYLFYTIKDNSEEEQTGIINIETKLP